MAGLKTDKTGKKWTYVEETYLWAMHLDGVDVKTMAFALDRKERAVVIRLGLLEDLHSPVLTSLVKDLHDKHFFSIPKISEQVGIPSTTVARILSEDESKFMPDPRVSPMSSRNMYREVPLGSTCNSPYKRYSAAESLEVDKGMVTKGYYVIGINKSAPSKVHPNYTSAVKEAERLAKSSIGCKFVVAEIKDTFQSHQQVVMERN